MEPTEASVETYETRSDLERIIVAAGSPMPSEHQLERWRGEGLLPPVRQVPKPYDGSTVEFPVGTAKQITEIQRLLKIKSSFEFVGWELWWAGFPVDEKHWKPRLRTEAANVDCALETIRNVY